MEAGVGEMTGSRDGERVEAGGDAPDPRALSEQTPVSRVMVRQVMTASPGMPAARAAQMMLDNGVSRMPVVDSERRVVGVISKTDFIEEQVDQGDGYPAGARPVHAHLGAATVSDLMTRRVITLLESSSLAEAARLMVAHKLHGIPVTDQEGKLLGFVSSLDLVAWLAGLS